MQDITAKEAGIETIAPQTRRQAYDQEAAVLEKAARPVVDELRAKAVTLHKNEIAESLRLAGRVGAINAFQLNEAVSRVAMLKTLAEIHESKAYKGLHVLDRKSGEPVVVQTWADFCNAQGFSKSKIHEDLQNLATFGGNLLEMQEALGLGYRDLRLLRNGISQLPETERAAILQEMENTEGPESLKEKLADLRLELAKEKASNKELKESAAAKDKVSKDKSARLDELEEMVERLTSMSPDDQEMALADLNLKARKATEAVCLNVFTTVIYMIGKCTAILADDRSSVETCRFVHDHVSKTMQDVADSILKAGIDVDLRKIVELPGDEEAGAN